MMRVQKGQRHTGLYGTAQQVTVPDHHTAETNVSMWFMHMPNQAPNNAWDKYMLAISSLANVPGLPPANLHYPDAEYELLVCALAPDAHPDIDDGDTWVPMDPPNMVHQFHGVTREQASRIASYLAWACVHGELITETQIIVQPFGDAEPHLMLIGAAVDRWNEAVRQLVEHEQTGGLHGAQLN
jgi:hypothetical protein